MLPRVILRSLVCLLSFAFFGQLTLQAQSDQNSRDSVPSLSTPDRYRLQPNDVLEIQYRYSPEYNETATIQPDGFINLPLIGDLKVGGMTVEQARKIILQKASLRLKDPEISLKLKEFERPAFIVSGQVKSPGRYDFKGKTMVSEAIAIAGGFIDTSKTSQVLLFRKLNTEWSEVIEINLKDDKNRRKKLTEDLSLRPGDMLFVPQNKISKLERVVRNTAPFNPFGIVFGR